MKRPHLYLLVGSALLCCIADAAASKSKGSGGGVGVVVDDTSAAAGTGVIGAGLVTAEDIDMSFNGAHFVIMTVEDPPFVAVRESTFNRSSPLLPPDQWHGFVIDIIKATAARSDFTYELVLPNTTYSYKQGYDGLVEGTNGVQVFWGMAYIGTKRLHRSFMSAPFWHSPLALVVPHMNETKLTGLSAISMDFLAPFTSELWINIIWLFVMAGVFYAIIEPMNHDDFTIAGVPISLDICISEIYMLVHSAGGLFPMLIGFYFISPSDYVDQRRDSFQRKSVQEKLKIAQQAETQSKSDIDRLLHKRDAVLHHLGNLADILFHSTYLGMCIITGANVWQPSSRGGKIFTLGVSMFAVILVSAYTANLAVFLSNRPDSFLVEKLEDFRSSDSFRLCVLKDSAYLNNYLLEHSQHQDIEYVQASGMAEYIEFIAEVITQTRLQTRLLAFCPSNAKALDS
jgi:hypothetical protein